jgi:HEPN domain-containing protein
MAAKGRRGSPSRKTVAKVAAVIPSAMCFHCQQAVEKYLKSLLQESGQHVPKTHDLQGLIDQLLPNYPRLRRFRRSGKALTKFAVEYRYPGATATRRQALSAEKTVERVRTEVRRLLGLRRRP